MIFTTLASTGIASTVTVPNIITAIPTRANSFTQYGAAVSNQNDIVNIDFGNKDIIIDKKSMTNIHGKPNGNGRLVVSGKSFNLSSDATQLGYGIPAPTIGLVDGDDITINGNVKIKQVGDEYGTAGIGMTISGVGTGAKTSLVINGDVDMVDGNNPGVVSAIMNGGNASYNGIRWAPVGINAGNGHGSKIDINGLVNIYAKGVGIQTDPMYADANIADKDLVTVNIDGGTIKTPESTTESYYSLASYGGTINMNYKNNIAGSNDVNLVGNVIASKNHNSSGEPYYYRDGVINIGLNTAQSKWKGVVDNFGSDTVGNINLVLGNGATWEYAKVSKTNGLDSDSMPAPSNAHYVSYDGVSHINKLTGDANRPGNIYMKDSAPLHIKKYSGTVNAFYNHTGTGTERNDYASGGDITIIEATNGSKIHLITDNTGIAMTNTNSVTSALNTLASKLIYSDSLRGKSDLKGTVQIAEGLTASSATLKLGDITYDATEGRGQYINNTLSISGTVPGTPSGTTPGTVPGTPSGTTSGTVPGTPSGRVPGIPSGTTPGTVPGIPSGTTPGTVPGIPSGTTPVIVPGSPSGTNPGTTSGTAPVITGDYESAVMRGVRAGIVSSLNDWRYMSNSITRNLHSYVENGPWAKVSRGKATYNNGMLHNEDTFTDAQVGYGKKINNGWHINFVVTHRNGTSHYIYDGTGKRNATIISTFGNKSFNDGSRVAVGVVAGRISNDFTIHNDFTMSTARWDVTGKYNAIAYGLIGEYAKRININGIYIEPQAQMTLSRIQPKDFTMYKGSDNMTIHQNTFNSIVGRIGLEVGKKMAKTNIYTRIDVSHEFSGKQHTSFDANDGGYKSTNHSLQDTWIDFTAGIEHSFTPNIGIYSEIMKGLGNSYKNSWVGTLGVKYLF